VTGYHRLQDEDRTRIVQMFKDGIVRAEISRRIHRDSHTITKVLVRAGFRLKTTGAKSPCPIPKMRCVLAMSESHQDQIAATCFCIGCERRHCQHVTVEQHAAVMADFAAWTIERRERYERVQAEAEFYRTYRNRKVQGGELPERQEA